ncbi:MAG: multidrug transporter [Proteobacteria bacterium]|jgi:multidrug resistance efflux pump|nr:multidrug transporter [Pseudomonadota bacterium]
MEAILIAIYAFFVWLIFIKFKWLPWNTKSQVIVVIIPIVAITGLILTLNVVAPSSPDVRVIKYVVQVIPQVRGRVIEVPVTGNDYVKKGTVLFKIDPTPYNNTVKQLEGKLAANQAALNEALAGLSQAGASVGEMREAVNAAAGQVGAIRANLDLAKKRVAEYRELVATGAGDRFGLEKWEANVRELEGQLVATTASESQAKLKLSARSGGDQAAVAQAKAKVATAKAQAAATQADLDNARWELTQTVMVAPADGWVMNLQLRPGSFVVGAPFAPAMTFVEDNYQVIALYHQNELHQVQPGDAAELALDTLPGKIIKAKVNSIVWGQGQGQLPTSGVLPQTGAAPQFPNRFAVKLDIEPRDKSIFLAAGAAGDAAIYSQRLKAIHILRMVILRVGSYTNYLIPKLH